MNWIVGEPIHITSADLEPVDDVSLRDFFLAVLDKHLPKTPPDEEETPSE